MVKFFEQTTVFNYTWEQVAQGFWHRYPNPNSKHVLSEDIVERKINSSGQLISKRLLSKTNAIPKLAERFINSTHVMIVEESIVDPRAKTLTTYTRNLGFTKVMSCTEKVVYKESRENPGKTVAIRTAWIDSQIRGFKGAICAFGIERFRKNCAKMVGGFNYVLANMFPNATSNSHSIPNNTVTNKLKDAAKNASELAKAKAKGPLYANLQH